MGTFLSNIQVFAGERDTARLLEELAHVVRDRLASTDYNETDDAESADRSLILQVSSDRWISVYDQALDEQDIDEMDALGTSMSARAGVPAVGSVVHDSDLLVMRLYRDGRTADTIINNLDIFNEMSEGIRPRKRNGLPSKWAELCAPDVNPVDLKAIWENGSIFADDALALAAELLAIPAASALRGYKIDAEFTEATFTERQTKVLHFQSKIRFSDYYEPSDEPKLAFTYWSSFAQGDAGVSSTLDCGLTNQGQAFTGLDVLLWGPGFGEGLIEPRQGSLIRFSHDLKTRDEWIGDLQPFAFGVREAGSDQTKQINGYRYKFQEIAFPEGFTQVQYPETAVQLGILNKWSEKFYHPRHTFKFVFAGISVGVSEVYIAFVPREAPKGQLVWRLPIYIGVAPPIE